jgi:hypothetical protein
MSNQTSQDEANTPDWLRTIQLNSWEAELLVSALVLYALFQVPDFIKGFALQNFERSSLFHGFFNVIKRAVELLSLGYITHILVRGVWVANVGLSYVFPNGIDSKRLGFKGKFGKEVESQSSLVKSVLRLERLSSLIYGISFLLFGLILGFGTLFLPFVALSELLPKLVEPNSSYTILMVLAFFLYMAIFLILFIDFVTNGLFRRIEWTAKIYYPVSLILRVLTLSFLYRRALLVLVSNVKGWRSYLIPTVLFIVSASFIVIKKQLSIADLKRYLQNNQAGMVVSANYENSRAKGEYFITTIKSDLISESVLSVFIKDVGIFETIHKWEALGGKKWEELNSQESSEYLNQWLTFTIDSVEYSPEWHLSQHPDDRFFGFSSFLDIKALKRGKHSLKVAFDTTSMEKRYQDRLMQTEYHGLILSDIQFFYNKEE